MHTSLTRNAFLGAMILISLATSACASASNGSGDTPQESGSPRQSSSPPAMQIDPAKSYQAVFTIDVGQFTARLFPGQAPVTVNNFVFLARQGYYDNTTFHRVLPGFMAQGGDPTGTGAGGPGYTFHDEFSPELEFDKPGLLAMANRGPDTNGSQFFITYAPTPHLNGLHTIFGEVIEGADILDHLKPRDPQGNPDFPGSTLLSVEIIETNG